MITSPQNPKIKAAARLRDARGRKKQRRFVVDGVREIGRALGAGIRFREVFVCRERGTRTQRGEVERLLRDLEGELQGADVIEVAAGVFEKLAFGERAEGIVAVGETPVWGLERLEGAISGTAPLIGVIERIEKPGNVGAVLRSADGAGLDGLIVADPRTDLFNPNAIRASLGTLFTVPTATATSAETLEWLREKGISIFAAWVDGSVSYERADYRGASAIVLGNEAEGLSETWGGEGGEEGIQRVRLPMLGVADSLNVSVAAAVLFYEARRQKGDGGFCA